MPEGTAHVPPKRPEYSAMKHGVTCQTALPTFLRNVSNILLENTESYARGHCPPSSETSEIFYYKTRNHMSEGTAHVPPKRRQYSANKHGVTCQRALPRFLRNVGNILLENTKSHARGHCTRSSETSAIFYY
jgi:hypothetical protein